MTRAATCGALILLVAVSGCVSSGSMPTREASARVSLLMDSEELQAILCRHGAAYHTEASGLLVLKNTASTRTALMSYLAALRDRMNLASENIANMNTLLDSSGRNLPYRRKFLRVEKDGTTAVAADPSPLRRVYDPTSLYANADGYVLYPNVDVIVEQIDGLLTARAYNVILEALKRLDPTIVADPVDITPRFDATLTGRA